MLIEQLIDLRELREVRTENLKVRADLRSSSLSSYRSLNSNTVDDYLSSRLLKKLSS